jgi:cell division protein FtsI (penicillin-binding protein 3)
MEVATGKIKAISNLRVTETGEFVEQYNSAIGESYEPGSVWKVFSAMAAFEDELIDLDDSLDIQNGERDYFGKPMQDSDKGRFQKMSFTQAFARSSNVAFSSIIFDNYNKNPSKYLAHLKTLDLDKKTGIEILGEPKPFLNHPSSSSWSKLTLPWLAIGYENQHTPLQLLAAYNGIINDGKMIKPRLVNEVTDAGLVIKDNNKKVKEVTVCSKETSDKIKKLTAAVFTEGSASNVKSNVVALAGKTGTAQIASGGAYQTTKLYNASFVGHFPADKPAYSIYVMINRPSNGVFYASYVAAPVFAEIAEKIYTISVKQEVNASVKKAPTYTAGYVSDFNILSRYLNISLNEEIDGEVVRIDATKGTAKNVVVNTGIMPNVKGLGAKDAMYLLEMQGLKPLISGYGRVMEQSPNPGVRVIKNQRVRIQLK